MKIYQMIRQAMLSPSTHAAASPVGHRLRRDGVADRKRPARSRSYGYRIYWLNSISRLDAAMPVHLWGFTKWSGHRRCCLQRTERPLP